MKLELLVGGTENCWNGPCPAVYKADNGSYVVQGYILDAETKQGIDFGEREDAVEIPAALVEALLKQLR